MGVDLHAAENVVFDHATCASLIASCNEAASRIEGQAGARASAVAAASVDFLGHFADVFGFNAGQAVR